MPAMIWDYHEEILNLTYFFNEFKRVHANSPQAFVFKMMRAAKNGLLPFDISLVLRATELREWKTVI